MIRVVIFLLVLAGLAFGATWLADRPGEVTIVWPWLGRAIELPLGLVIAVFALLIGCWLLLLIWRSPGRVAGSLRRRRAARGYRAISRGLIAIGAGDLASARRFAGDARRLAPNEPLALLLGAQTAQLAGNRAAAETTFRRMTEHDETKMLGLHGLFVEARRRNDAVSARAAAEEAARANPSAGWAAQAVLDFRCMEGDWTGALSALGSQTKSGLIDRAADRRGRAVLLTARALSSGERESALADVSEAVRLAPGLVPAAAFAGRLLAEAGKPRPAARIIEAAWRENPHPDLAETYAHVRPGGSARDRLARIEALAKLAPAGPESEREAMLAVARAAIDARELAAARAALAPLLETPSRRVALMMAEIEDHEGDVGRARQWTARALNAAPDPAWAADGYVSDKWLPVSPVTGRLDAFQWKVPVTALSPPARIIEEPAPAPAPVEATAATVDAEPAPMAAPSHPPAPPPADEDAPEYDGSPHAPPVAPAPARDAAPIPAPHRPGEASRADPVIPLVHSPDDPGPDGDLPPEPTPGPPKQENWWRGLFR